MKRTRLYKLIIAALVIINVVILILFFTGGPGHRPPKSGDLAEKLGIEGKKEMTITKLESDHHKAKRKLMDKDRKLHEELFSKLGTDENVSELQEEIEENFAEIEKMTYDFFNEVAKLCSDEQKEELKKTIYLAFRQMKGPKR